jgi:hypothetical protein
MQQIECQYFSFLVQLFNVATIADGVILSEEEAAFSSASRTGQ